MNPYQTSTISYRGDVFQKKTGARVSTPVFLIHQGVSLHIVGFLTNHF